ncbi:hypothetical protein Tcan_16941 [Toxocara canis]|uniref:Peptidase S1 domain-containing protein n=1 Tax=Toxocara canis TaxID=6265 RepID=A0A0B2VK83_TOXCA|nr:hypothetical protein Tcan_16941 [Toxocara canis]
MLSTLSVSLILLSSFLCNNVLLANDRAADPESYPYALRLVAFSRNNTRSTYHHSCIALLLSRSLLITSAVCVQPQDGVFYLAKSYKIDELDRTPLAVDTFIVDNTMLKDAMLLCRRDNKAYRLVDIVPDLDTNSTEGQLQSIIESVIFKEGEELTAVGDGMPQIWDQLIRVGKFVETVKDGDMCDAFYAFNNDYFRD